MNTLYSATVTGIGADVPTIVEECMLIFFDEKAPKELHDIAVVHRNGGLADEIRSGDKFVLDQNEYEIVAVGDTVNATLRDLGHFTVHFTRNAANSLPGSICVEADSVPDVSEGSTFRILRGN